MRGIEYLNSDGITIDDFHILPGIGWSLYQLIEYIEKILDREAIIKVIPREIMMVERVYRENLLRIGSPITQGR